jgi:methylamine dehydrogenase heavy chain
MKGGLMLARFALTAIVVAQGVASAQNVQVEPFTAEQLPAKASPHWVWVNDVVFHHMADGKSFLVDGDKGRMLGMLSTGSSSLGVVLPRNGSAVLSPEIYFSRGTRGERTDVVTFYHPQKLAPMAEVSIPPKRVSSMPMAASASLTDDDRFLLVYNFTPAQSISVVDTVKRAFVGEIEIAGCALAFPTGRQGFFSLCNDGTAMQVSLDPAGKPASKTRSARLFDPVSDPITEKGVRAGTHWLFATFQGAVVPVDVSGPVPRALKSWSMLDGATKGWRPGGLQHLAWHAGDKRLYSLMHEGGPNTHKDPGSEVWVYDTDKKSRVQRIQLKDPATSIAVTRDAAPLLFAIYMGAQKVDVYEARSGKFLRSIAEIGFTPTTLATY